MKYAINRTTVPHYMGNVKFFCDIQSYGSTQYSLMIGLKHGKTCYISREISQKAQKEIP